MSTDEYNQLHEQLRLETAAYITHKELGEHYAAILRNSQDALALLVKAGKDGHKSGSLLRQIITELTPTNRKVWEYVEERANAAQLLNERIQNALVSE